MSYRAKNFPPTELVTCEKYIKQMLKNEKLFSTKRSPVTPAFQEKVSTVVKPPVTSPNQRQKQKSNNSRQQNPLPKIQPPICVNKQRDSDAISTLIESSKQRNKSRGRCRSTSSDRESWGQILHKNRSKDKVSSFSNFDPLRTVHFLSRELYTKLQGLMPDDDSVIQIITDMQHALKRIPTEVTILQQDSGKFTVMKPISTSKSCQTPPTLYQEDTEKFQKIMEENTYRLETSCKQLEIVCTNLQKEKEMTEKELEDARENVELLCKKVKNLEQEMEQITSTKIQQLENEKRELHEQVNRYIQEARDNPVINSLKRQIEDMQQQKISAEENCARLEYDVTLLKMEKEKFITMLSLRDREIKDIQEEMVKIQEQVHCQLKKLNMDMLPKVNNMKSLSNDPSYIVTDHKDTVDKAGDTTISTINSDDSEKESVLKEVPCGDGGGGGGNGGRPTIVENNHNNLMERLSRIRTSKVEILGDQKTCASFEQLLKELSPSCRALMTPDSASYPLTS